MTHCERCITFFDLTDMEARIVRLARQSWAAEAASTAALRGCITAFSDDRLALALGALLQVFDRERTPEQPEPTAETTLCQTEEQLLAWLADGAPTTAGPDHETQARCRAALREAGVSIRCPDQIAEDARIALEKRIDHAYLAVAQALVPARCTPLDHAVMSQHGTIMRLSDRAELHAVYKHDSE